MPERKLKIRERSKERTKQNYVGATMHVQGFFFSFSFFWGGGVCVCEEAVKPM